MSDLQPVPPPLPRLEPRPLWRQTLDEHDDLEEGDQRGHQSIGGWLILFAVGRVLSPFFLASALLIDLRGFTKPGVWSRLTTPGSVVYHPFWSVVMVYQTAGNALLLLFSIVLALLFFARWKACPPLMVGFMVSLALFYWGAYLLCLQIPALKEHASGEQINAALSASITALIWVPYFLTSVRVRYTFVK